MTAPIKTCDYCGATGEMPTFMNGETICYTCLRVLPKTLPEARQELMRLRAVIAVVAQPAPSVPREAIDKMLTQLMDIAVSNGANSISMPDEYVEVAAWLCGIPAQPAPSINDDVMRDAKRYRFLRAAKNIPISKEAARDPIVYDAAVDAAMLAAAPEANQ